MRHTNWFLLAVLVVAGCSSGFDASTDDDTMDAWGDEETAAQLEQPLEEVVLSERELTNPGGTVAIDTVPLPERELTNPGGTVAIGTWPTPKHALTDPGGTVAIDTVPLPE